MESMPEQYYVTDSLETLRSGIDSANEKIFETIKAGMAKNMGYNDLMKFVPKPIEHEIENENNKTEDMEINGEQQFPDWVSAFGNQILENENDHMLNYMPELIISSYDDSKEGLQSRMALLVYSRAILALRAGKIKQQQGVPIINLKREKEILEKAQKQKHGEMTRTIMEQIIGVCRQLQEFELGVLSVEDPENRNGHGYSII